MIKRLLVCLFVCLVSIVFFVVINEIFIAKKPKSKTIKLLHIEKGWSANKIANYLQKKGIIKNALSFKIYIKLTGKDKYLRSGFFELSEAFNIPKICQILTAGQQRHCKITIVEGWNLNQIAQMLEDKNLIKKEKFLKLANDKKFLKKLTQLDIKTLEGLILADTYFLPTVVSGQEIINLLFKEFKKRIFKPSYIEKARELGLSIYEVAILASLIQKETYYKPEIQLISAVFHRRLKLGIPLESDPTVIYALGKEFDGNLTKEDLKINSSYNTYIYKGLPPSPICSFSREAFLAALYPAKVDYLYFVSRQDGSHVFAKTLKEHKLNVAKYQLSK